MPEYTHNGMTVRAEIVESLEQYRDLAIPTGDFLRAVISNDLKEACGRADDDNARNLCAIVAWLYNNAPMGCWGSVEKYENWVKQERKL